MRISSRRWLVRWTSVAGLVAAAGLVAVAEGCGGSAPALDARDISLPFDTRLWIAGAEDSVIVARADHDAAETDLREIEEWADRALGDIEWEDKSPGTRKAFERFVEARVELAQRELARADAALELNERKLKLAHAEGAMRADRGRYDLEPLRASVIQARGELRAAVDAVIKQRTLTEQASTEWWTAYAGYVRAGGDTTSYWTFGGDR